EGVELAILVEGDEDRLPARLGGVVLVLLGNLAFVSEVDPVALEDVLHLQFEQALVGEHLALAAEDALLFVVFNERIKVIESQGHGRGLHCYCFYVMKAKALGGASISVFCRTSIRFLQMQDGPLPQVQARLACLRREAAGSIHEGRETGKEAAAKGSTAARGDSVMAAQGVRWQLAEGALVAFRKAAEVHEAIIHGDLGDVADLGGRVAQAAMDLLEFPLAD